MLVMLRYMLLILRILEIGYGSWVNCNIFGRESITIESGEGSKGCTLINGSVISDGKVSIVHPLSKNDDYKEGYLIVKGNIIGKDIEISAPTIVFGNVISDESIIINDSTFIGGGVVSKRILAQKLTCNFISGEDLELGNIVSVFTPAIIAKNIQFEKIRVITSVCKKCGEENGIDVISCDFNSCDKCLVMDKDDIVEFEDYKVVTTAWRTFKENEESFNWLKEYLYEIYCEKDKFVEFGKLKYAGISKDSMKVELKVEVKPEVEPKVEVK
jgi:hypothetical protein